MVGINTLGDSMEINYETINNIYKNKMKKIERKRLKRKIKNTKKCIKQLEKDIKQSAKCGEYFVMKHIEDIDNNAIEQYFKERGFDSTCKNESYYYSGYKVTIKWY